MERRAAGNLFGKAGKDQGAVFAAVEERWGKVCIRLSGTGEWLSLAEVKVSPKCKNVIAWGEDGPVLWRSELTVADIAALAAIEEGK